MEQQNLKQFEEQLKTSGFALASPFHENEKSEVIAQVVNEKGEQMLITILSIQEGRHEHAPQYKFQLLGSEKGGENAGKTFTLEQGELEKALPVIQKNPNQALKLKLNGWNFAAPLAGMTPGISRGLSANALTGALPEILPMPPAGITKNLAKRILGKEMADRQAMDAKGEETGQQILKTVGSQLIQPIGRPQTLAEMMRNSPRKKIYPPQIPEKIRIKIPTDTVSEGEKGAPELNKLRGEISMTKSGESGQKKTQPQDAAQAQAQADQVQRFTQAQEQSEQEEIPLIPFLQKGKSKKSRLLRWAAIGTGGGAAAAVAGSGLFPIFFS